KIIEGLRLELAEAQIKLVEVENMGGGRMQDLQRQMYEVKMQNARLMEENESFQLLLTERTLHGEFSNSEFLRPPSNAGGSRPPSRQPNQGGASLADELNGEDVDASFMTTTTEGGASAGTSTDDQAKRLQGEISSLKDQNKALTLYINNIISRLLQHEQFETILDKTPDLMSGGANSSKSNPQQARGGTATAAANTDKDLPPPPPPKDEIRTTFDNLEGRRPPQDPQPADEDDQKPLGFLQRAKSVMSGGGSGAGNRSSRPRPVTQVPSASEQQKLQERIRAAEEEKAAAGGGVTENPDTAPRVPLGGGLARGGSVRGGGGGHRRANSDWNAAGLVGNMFKGASSSSSSGGGGGGGWGGPLSPGLTSPTGAGPGGRNSFFSSAAFTSQQSQQPAQSSRVPSGGAAGGQQVPTISETDGGSSAKENALPSSTTNPSNPTTEPDSEPSTTSAGAAPGGSGGGNSSSSTGPSSPPRSTTSSGERDRGGAVMMGSKPRPLRLVQEAKEDEAASKKANRGSWFGWMNKGGSGSGGTGTGSSGGAGGGRSVSGSGNGDA
ncbi:hypothetical protein KC324_g10110, partial [Hortaea werneckii]